MENVVNTGYKPDEDDEAVVHSLNTCASFVLPMVLNAAIELNLFEIISKAGYGARLSASEIASQLPTSSVEGVRVLESMLRLLASNSFLTCSTSNLDNGETRRTYGLTRAGRCFVKDEITGVSLIPYHVFSCTESRTELWFHLKDAVLADGSTFRKDLGKDVFEHTNSNQVLGNMFNDSMASHAAVIMKKVLKVYKGFEGLSSIVNVGGGYGVTLDMIISEYPSIRGVNFDLPEVIQTAPIYKGIEHVAGDMFREVPRGDAIFLKSVLHNWSDERCVALLKNCYKALPKKGKIIVIDSIMSEIPQSDGHAKYAYNMDIIMLAINGGKERTEDEFKSLAITAGFAEIKVVCYVCGLWVMEFIK